MLRSLASLSTLPLLFILANAFGPLMNHTICCETAIFASTTDHVNFPFNFALWNSKVRKNDTIPCMMDGNYTIPSMMDGNDAWNKLVHKKSKKAPQAEYLDFRCGVVYSSANGSESPAAMSVRVPLAWAIHTPACIGFEGAQLSDVDRWGGPLVAFILTGIVFGLSIPSGWALTEVLRASNSGRHKRQWILWRLLAGMLNTAAFLVLSILEILRWAIIILTCAGPILSSTVQEMYLDHVLLSELYRPPAIDSSTSSTTQLHRRRLLLAILLSNASDPDGSLATSAKSTILDAPDAQARAYLRILLAANSEFDVAIGTPVAFYTAGYAYALYDAYKRLGDHITSTALTLGLWYMEFAIVAVVSGCLLGCPNPAIITSIAYESPPSSPIRLVAPWNRGRSARAWAAWADPELKLRNPVYKCSLVSFMFIGLPCCLAFVVSYRAPVTGLGCRSMSVLLYMFSQLILILLHTLYSILPHSTCVRALLLLLLPLTLFLAFISAVGGTVLQMTGLYVNVYCWAGVISLLNPDSSSYSAELATDTLLVRRIARYRWRYTGIAGLGFLCAVCVAAWLYRRVVHKQCEQAIAAVQTIPTPAQAAVRRSHFRSIGSSTHDRVSRYIRRSLALDPFAGDDDIPLVSAPSTLPTHVHDVPRWGHRDFHASSTRGSKFPFSLSDNGLR